MIVTYRYCYDHEAKEKFHAECRKILRSIAKDLKLPKGSFDVRSCKGGPAVFGEVTLHTDRLYLQICGGTSPPKAYYRTCEGRKDYSGGSNNWLALEDLTAPSKRAATIKLLRPIAIGEV